MSINFFNNSFDAARCAAAIEYETTEPQPLASSQEGSSGRVHEMTLAFFSDQLRNAWLERRDDISFEAYSRDLLRTRRYSELEEVLKTNQAECTLSFRLSLSFIQGDFKAAAHFGEKCIRINQASLETWIFYIASTILSHLSVNSNSKLNYHALIRKCNKISENADKEIIVTALNLVLDEMELPQLKEHRGKGFIRSLFQEQYKFYQSVGTLHFGPIAILALVDQLIHGEDIAHTFFVSEKYYVSNNADLSVAILHLAISILKKDEVLVDFLFRQIDHFLPGNDFTPVLRQLAQNPQMLDPLRRDVALMVILRALNSFSTDKIIVLAQRTLDSTTREPWILEELERLLQWLQKLSPEGVQTHYCLGRYYQIHDDVRMVRHYEAVCRLSSKVSDSHLSLGRYFVQHKQFDKAVVYLNTFLSHHSVCEAHYLYALASCQLSEHETAAKHFHLALQTLPKGCVNRVTKKGELLYQLAQSLRELGRHRELIQYTQIALKCLGPESGNYESLVFLHCETLLELGDLEGAKRFIQTLDPTSFCTQMCQAEYEVKDKNFAAALDIFNASLEHPLISLFYDQILLCLWELGRRDEAYEWVKKVSPDTYNQRFFSLALRLAVSHNDSTHLVAMVEKSPWVLKEDPYYHLARAELKYTKSRDVDLYRRELTSLKKQLPTCAWIDCRLAEVNVEAQIRPDRGITAPSKPVVSEPQIDPKAAKLQRHLDRERKKALLKQEEQKVRPAIKSAPPVKTPPVVIKAVPKPAPKAIQTVPVPPESRAPAMAAVATVGPIVIVPRAPFDVEVRSKLTAEQESYYQSALTLLTWLEDWQKDKSLCQELRRPALLYTLFKMAETLYRFENLKFLEPLRHTLRHAPHLITPTILDQLIDELKEIKLKEYLTKLLEGKKQIRTLTLKATPPLSEPSPQEIAQIMEQEIGYFDLAHKRIGENPGFLATPNKENAALCHAFHASFLSLGAALRKYYGHAPSICKEHQYIIEKGNNVAHHIGEPEVLKVATLNIVSPAEMLWLLYNGPRSLNLIKPVG